MARTFLAHPQLLSNAHYNVLDILETNRKVHDDLRSVSIMVNVSYTGEVVLVDDGSGRADIRVVDFDWAGDAGSVSYSPSWNEDIAGIIGCNLARQAWRTSRAGS